MGWNFRKRVRIAPGVNVNFSKKGTSVTVGTRGANVNIGKSGTYQNLGVPGTGLYSREKISNKSFSFLDWLFPSRKKKNESYTETVNREPIPEVIKEPDQEPKLQPTPPPPKPKDILDDVDIEYYIGKIAFEEAAEELPYIPSSYWHFTLVGEEPFDLGRIYPNDRDPLFDEAARLIVVHQQGSTSLIQRKFSIGYNRSVRLMDQLEAAGIVGPTQGSKARDVLISDEYSLEQKLNSLL